MDSFLPLFSISLLLLPLHMAQNSSHSHITEFQVGLILDLKSSDSSVGRIGNSCISSALSDFYSVHENYRTRLVLNVKDSNGSVVDAAAAALELLRDVKVDAIIGPQKSTQANFVMDLGDRAHVPIISFSATCPCLISLTPYFFQTAQSDANQVQVIASIVKAFKWNQVVIIYEDSEFGNGIIPYLSNALNDVNARIPYRSVFPIAATDDSISKELYKLMTMQTRVFVVHMSQHLGNKLFLKSKELGMMSDGYAWIVTSGLTDLFKLMHLDVAESMQGVLGVRPLVPKSKRLQEFSARWIREFSQANKNMRPTELSVFGLWAYDTVWALAMAAERVRNSSTTSWKNDAGINSSGLFTLPVSETGPKLLSALSETNFIGLAGEFNLVKGRQQQSPYQIVNIVGKYEREVGIWTASGGISKELNLNITSSYSTSKENIRNIIWPGDSTRAPKGWEVPTSGKKLRVGVPQKPGFNEFLKVETDPQTNTTYTSGYFKDVFDAVMAALPYAVPYEYIAYPFFSSEGSSIGNYDDLVYQVSLQEKYDAALGDITITANRSNYADFTLPYAEGGVTSLAPIKYGGANYDIWTFFQPLTWQLWLTAGFSYIATGLAIWFLGRVILNSSGEQPDQHPGMTCHFPFFPGVGTHHTLLCVVLVTWGLVWSLLNSTYTASLSSRLTVQSIQPTVTDVNQLIKNGEYVGCQEGSFVVDFLINLGFDESKIRKYESTEDCNEALTLGSKQGGISAYYDVLPHIRLILSQYCGKYMIVGPTHRTAGFAIAFPKNSPVVADVSRAIIQLTENGIIHEIEQRFSANLACSPASATSSPSSVTLGSFWVLFLLTGLVTSTCLIVSWLLYLHKKRAFLHRMSDLKSSLGPRTHALQRYLKEGITSSFLKIRNTRG